MDFFSDDDVKASLAELGLQVEATPSGSRQISTRTDLADFDPAFPSSAPSAEKIQQETSPISTYSPFYSPMAIATFTPILEALSRENVARQQDGVWYVDMGAYLELSESQKRWRDIVPDFASPLEVTISSTVVRSSNSAAMYLSILSWVANNNQVVSNDAEVDKVVRDVSPLFTKQGYTGGSSAGPYSEYLTQGMGARPMVMIYESQFLGTQIDNPDALGGDRVLAYPDPTLQSEHTFLAYTDAGDALGKALSEDDKLLELEVKYGFRPNKPGVFG